MLVSTLSACLLLIFYVWIFFIHYQKCMNVFPAPLSAQYNYVWPYWMFFRVIPPNIIMSIVIKFLCSVFSNSLFKVIYNFLVTLCFLQYKFYSEEKLNFFNFDCWYTCVLRSDFGHDVWEVCLQKLQSSEMVILTCWRTKQGEMGFTFRWVSWIQRLTFQIFKSILPVLSS